MTNPGLPPALSTSLHHDAETRLEALKTSLDDALAELDDVLGRPPVYGDGVPSSRQNFNRKATAA